MGGCSSSRHFAVFLKGPPSVLVQKEGHVGIQKNLSTTRKPTTSTMAFDHPVEADRVDLNLGSIISRAPVIGSLMYLLGGRHAREEEEQESASRKQLDRSLASDSQNLLTNSFKPIKSALKKSSPSLAPTEEASDNESFQSALDCYDRHDTESTFGRKKKELSWSDQSGLNLVEYIDAQPVSRKPSSFCSRECKCSFPLAPGPHRQSFVVPCARPPVVLAKMFLVCHKSWEDWRESFLKTR